MQPTTWSWWRRPSRRSKVTRWAKALAQMRAQGKRPGFLSLCGLACPAHDLAAKTTACTWIRSAECCSRPPAPSSHRSPMYGKVHGAALHSAEHAAKARAVPVVSQETATLLAHWARPTSIWYLAVQQCPVSSIRRTAPRCVRGVAEPQSRPPQPLGPAFTQWTAFDCEGDSSD